VADRGGSAQGARSPETESTRTDKETAAFRWGTERAKEEMEEVIDAMETESQLRDDMRA
jgi:hypothetical protein